MTEYRAPLRDMKFVINELADLHGVFDLPGFEELTPSRGGRFGGSREIRGRGAGAVNKPGDERGASLGMNGGSGGWFWRAYRASSITAGVRQRRPRIGGQGLPSVLAAATAGCGTPRICPSRCCPMLTGAMEAIEAHASDELKAIYPPHLISGEWSGTMNLTHPQAGSDLP